MPKTKGGLEPARIYEVDATGKKKGDLCVSFMFNPHQYTISLQHSYSEDGMGGQDAVVEISNVGQQSLRLRQIVFDTYDEGSDVTEKTKILWELMKPKPREASKASRGIKAEGKIVAFEWGPVTFLCYIESVSQTFILFTDEGTPVRAQVDITLRQYVPKKKKKQNPTSGGGPIQRSWKVTAGDRLDLIAAEVYRDAAKWTTIAEYNDIDDPLSLRPGQELMIPTKP